MNYLLGAFGYFGGLLLVLGGMPMIGTMVAFISGLTMSEKQ